MRIGKLTLHRATISGRDSILLELVASTHEGAVSGWGEATPLAGFSTETTAEAARALEHATRTLEGTDLEDTRQARELIAATTIPSARFALESALLAALAAERHTAVYQLLARDRGPANLAERVRRAGAAPPACMAADRTSAASLAVSHLARDARDARAAIERGIRTIKVKIGRGHLEADLLNLEQIRDAIGPHTALRIDANGQRSIAPARLLHELSRFQPELVEEPGPLERIAALEHTPIPLALDESLATPLGRDLLGPLARRGLLGAVILKPMLLGGSFAAIELADRARAYQLEPIVTHFFDGPIALQATRELALATMSGRYAAGLEPEEHR